MYIMINNILRCMFFVPIFIAAFPMLLFSYYILDRDANIVDSAIDVWHDFIDMI